MLQGTFDHVTNHKIPLLKVNVHCPTTRFRQGLKARTCHFLTLCNYGQLSHLRSASVSQFGENSSQPIELLGGLNDLVRGKHDAHSKHSVSVNFYYHSLLFTLSEVP